MNIPKLSKNNIFNVPEHYFDGLETAIQNKVQANRTEKKPVFYTLAPKIALAVCSIVILIVLIWPAYEKPDAVELLAQVSDEQLNNYLAEAEPIGAEDILFDTDISDADFFVLDPITTDTTF